MFSWGKLEVTWGVLIPPVLTLWMGAGRILPGAYLAALLHELGHLAALKAAGAPVLQLRLTALGAEILADTRYLSYGREILCAAAGPGVNLILAVLLARGAGDDLGAGIHLLLGVFNLLPVPSLDGGHILYLCVSWLTEPFTAERVCRWVGLLVSLGLTAGAFWLTIYCGGGFFLVFAALGVLIPQICSCQTRTNRIE